MADRSPVTLFTFFLELPYALPMTEGGGTVTVDRRDEHWAGWPDEQVAQILTRDDNPFPPAFVPGSRIVVRHVEATDRPPLLLAEEAFAEWVDELFPETEAAEREAKREEWGRSGIRVVKSVVALSRFVPRSAIRVGVRSPSVGCSPSFDALSQSSTGCLRPSASCSAAGRSGR